MEIDIKQLKSLMRALRRYGLSEIELRQGDEEIVIRRGAGVSGAAAPTSFPMTTAARGFSEAHTDMITGMPATTSKSAAPAADDGSVAVITSPLVGTFYRSPAPGVKSFVEVGSKVKVGEVVCIVEAMKLMNEIESDAEGIVAEILVDNGKPVEFGEKLFKIKKAG